MSQTTSAADTEITTLVDLSLNALVFIAPVGLGTFRQHLQNLARTKGFLELNKAQLVLRDAGGNTNININTQELSDPHHPYGHQVTNYTVLMFLMIKKCHMVFYVDVDF